MKINKKDLLLIAVILTIAAAGFLIQYLKHLKPAVLVEVTVNAEVVATLDISKDTTLDIQGFNNGTNHLVIQDGMTWIDEASCPDKVCIHQGRIQLSGQLIACRPNRVLVRVISQED